MEAQALTAAGQPAGDPEPNARSGLRIRMLALVWVAPTPANGSLTPFIPFAVNRAGTVQSNEGTSPDWAAASIGVPRPRIKLAAATWIRRNKGKPFIAYLLTRAAGPNDPFLSVLYAQLRWKTRNRGGNVQPPANCARNLRASSGLSHRS